MISGEDGLDALFDADAILREGHGIAVVAGERVDISIGGVGHRHVIPRI